MSYCAEFWTAKTHEELDGAINRVGTLVTMWEHGISERIKNYPKLIASAEKEVARLNAEFKNSLGDTVKKAIDAGVEFSIGNTTEAAKAAITATGNDAANTSHQLALKEAENALEGLKADQAKDRTSFAGAKAFRASISHCADEQRAYLEKEIGKQGATTTPPATAKSATMSGSWNVSCTDKKDPSAAPLDLSGAFDLKLTITETTVDESAVTGTLILGEDKAALTGTWTKSTKSLEANSTLSNRAWVVMGDIVESQGKLVSAGQVAGGIGTDYDCKGSYNGQQTN
jgi:hypothetical protein